MNSVRNNSDSANTHLTSTRSQVRALHCPPAFQSNNLALQTRADGRDDLSSPESGAGKATSNVLPAPSKTSDSNEFRGGFHPLSEQQREHSLKLSAARKSVAYAPEALPSLPHGSAEGRSGAGSIPPCLSLPPNTLKKPDKRTSFYFGANQPEAGL